MDAARDTKLVRMANQISDFFRPYDDAEAIAGIRDHIRAFWTGSMREALLAHAAAGGSGLQPRVAAAVESLRAESRDSPIEKVVAGPRELGQAASDAG